MSAKEYMAEQLNGRQYGSEVTRIIEEAAKEAGLVIVFGSSDDLIEFRGAIDEELGASNESKCYVVKKPNGTWIVVPEDEEELVFPASSHPPIVAYWNPPILDCSWLIMSDIPSAEFDIMEDDSLSCRGIVFALADLEVKITGAQLIATERQEQIEKHGFDVADDDYKSGELISAALFSIEPNGEFEPYWPDGWHEHYKKKIQQKSRIEALTVAGAFIAAEIDRELRKA